MVIAASVMIEMTVVMEVVLCCMSVMLFKVVGWLIWNVMTLSHCGYYVDILECHVPSHIYCLA